MIWLYFAISAFTILNVFANYFITYNTTFDRKTKILNSAFLLLILGILLAIATGQATILDGEQKDRIEQLSKIDTSFGRKNDSLGIRIDSISQLNNKIASNVQTMSVKNNELANDNITLSHKINGLDQTIQKLITNVNMLTESSAKIIKSTSEENALSGRLFFKFNRPLKDNDLIFIKCGGLEGSNPAGWYKPPNPPRFIAAMGDPSYDPVKVYVINGEMLLTLTIYDLDGNWIVDIDNNNWRRNPNTTGKFNYDSTGFEIIDNRGFTALNLNLSNNNRIDVHGYLVQRDKNTIFLFGDSQFVQLSYGPPLLSVKFKEAYAECGITRLFRYTGNWLHQRK